ncbi:DNA packaging protein [Pseudomonas multiresinivorans]|uniref:DNA packaging protein n=1 Tax=Pseudomonas multiresinivorans TaxID=95301 RepID=A0A7Z3BP55_9PSED|nr:DNA packaging protein [Pseudomonas multiresinivorans]QJP10465.1 DNA packaging protein [Pseudomonas multiresinivorans]
MAGGRPTDYSEDLAEVICLRLAEGDSLRTICRDDEMPDKATVLRWVARNEQFRDQYVRAKHEGAEALAEEMFDIADDASNDWMERLDAEGQGIGWQINGDHVRRSQLRIDVRKWYLSKIMPKKYGDKQQLQHTGGEGGPIDQNITITFRKPE